MAKMAELIASNISVQMESPLFPNTYFQRYAGTLLSEYKQFDSSFVRRVVLPDAIMNRDDWSEYDA